MDKQERRRAVKAICQRIDRELLPLGYRKFGSREWWITLDWRSYQVGLTTSKSWIVVTLQVWFPDDTGKPDGHGFEVENLSYLGGFPTGFYDVPDAPGGFEPAVGAFAAVAEKVCQDVPLILPWFERFSTPEKCLTELRARDHLHNSCPPGIPKYYWWEKYLLHLLNGGSPPEAKQLIP